MDRLATKVALISGGARGMGAAHARAIVAEGGRVVIGDVRDEEGEHLARELGPTALYAHLDVTSAEAWEAAVALAEREFGSLSALVNNAGITNFGAIGKYSEQDWETVLRINLTGCFLGITAALPALKRATPSSIVNISSTAGLQGSAELHGYTAAKWGVRGLTKSVAMEVGVDGVRVNSVHPGVVHTPMISGYDVSALGGGALGRGAEPEEISALVVYLVSDESSFVTGAEFVIDGGMTAGTPAFGPVKDHQDTRPNR
ncbi:SDR family oxidoreductase [Streptomyces sp. B3I8]|jgi:3alpha(or 20beta)-hydroxysteroid dehydrogenase|uniref:SDR family oxidoreductase n=1 Tax=Streptomyces sp. B3I8 TaxID=3042303 RepID=UPI0027854952|nr:SDR family oxidoreductase [Streptomyces sp. B3I8]MDQ0790802.1 3alpha(or 20beta)-hydroxysteroid dehydrogenase [Streptomyces sp. B3I8]